MIESILKLAAQDNIQFGAATLALIAIFFYIIRSILNSNKILVDQNQENVVQFLEQINHNQTKNREALASNTEALKKISELVDRNNVINERLLGIIDKR